MEEITETKSISLETDVVNNDDISESKKIIKSESPLLEKKDSQIKKKFYWNFVAGGDLVHEFIPIALEAGNIFWLNKKSTALSYFSILTQGIFSQSYQPENGNDYIMYRNQSSQEKKAILSFSEQRFIFSE